MAISKKKTKQMFLFLLELKTKSKHNKMTHKQKSGCNTHSLICHKDTDTERHRHTKTNRHDIQSTNRHTNLNSFHLFEVFETILKGLFGLLMNQCPMNQNLTLCRYI